MKREPLSEGLRWLEQAEADRKGAQFSDALPKRPAG